MDDGSFLAQGYAPTKHTVKMTVKTDAHADHGVPPRAAERPEPAAGRARPVDQGDGGLDRVPGRGRAGRRHGEGRRRSRSSQATADVNPPETPLEPIFDDQQQAKAGHRAGRLRHRRQGRDRLGNRRRPRPAQPAAQGGLHAREADRVPRRHDPDVPPQAEPRRLEQRRQPEQQPRPVPALDHDQRRTPTADPVPARRPRDPGDRSRASGPPRRGRAVFSYWRTTVPEWKEANDRIEALWSDSIRRARRSWCSASATSRGRRTCCSAAISSSRARPSTPGVPRS